jgi:hypothetical protein
MAWFYEIRSSKNAVLKRDGGLATQDAAKTAGRGDAKKMKSWWDRMRKRPGGFGCRISSHSEALAANTPELQTLDFVAYFVT